MKPYKFGDVIPEFHHWCRILVIKWIHFGWTSTTQLFNWGCQKPLPACLLRLVQISYLAALKLTWGDWLHSTGDPKHKHPEFQVSLNFAYDPSFSNRPPNRFNWRKHPGESYLCNPPNYNDWTNLHCAPTLGRFQARRSFLAPSMVSPLTLYIQNINCTLYGYQMISTWLPGFNIFLRYSLLLTKACC